MPYRKKLIEVALPLEAINEASAREKSIRHGHPSTLHLWWARRPLAACRAVIFASLVDDPDDPAAPAAFVEACRALPLGKNAAAEDTPRQRLFDFIERLVQWESTTDEQVLETARALIRLATDGNPPPLLDPFAGGGSIPLEAQRLGLEAHASDLNPVAVMINKALIEIPPRFANRPPVNPRDREKAGGGASWKGAAGLAADVRYYGEWMRERAWERIGHLYPKGPNGETVIAWLWARTVKCPNPACGAQMPLMTRYEICSRAPRKVWVEPNINHSERTVRFAVRKGRGQPPEPPKVGRGVQFRCLFCGEVAPEEYIKRTGVADHSKAQLIALVTEGPNGRNYLAASPEHEQTAQQIVPGWTPDLPMSTHPQYMAPPRYGMATFAELFTARQLVALSTFSELVAQVVQRVLADSSADVGNVGKGLADGGSGPRAYAEAVACYLGLNVGRQANRLSALCFWHYGRETVEPFFSRQAFTMNWDFAEANPFSGSSGNFMGQLDYLARVVESLHAEGRAGFVAQQDAVTAAYLQGAAISTDPPYYDNVPYADLSDFFYVWLRRSLLGIFPSLFSTLLVPKDAELVADHQRLGGREAADEYFETGMKVVFAKMRQAVEPSYPLSVYYAFKQSETDDNDGGAASTGWETMLEAMLQAGFVIDATWPMRTEQATNIKKYRNALASSIVLVCRPRPDDAPLTSRREFVAALRRELPPALRQMQSGNIAPVDLAQASIGPGMAVYSRYSKVLEPNGQPLTVRTALQLINQALDEYLAEQEGELDEASRFAVAWFEQYGFRDAEFGIADVLARAKNTSVETMAHAGFVSAAGGKVRLVPWQDLDPGRLPEGDVHVSVWEAVHYLVERFDSHGEEGAARLMARMPADLAAAARQLAYRLYSIAERKGWADHARDYNGLVVSWGASQQQALTLREHFQQGRLF